MSESSAAPIHDPSLQGVWKVLWRRVNGEPPRRGESLYLFGDYLLVHSHTNPIPFDYSADTTSSPCRLELRNRITGNTQNAIYQLVDDRLQICATCQFFDAKKKGLDFPNEFRTVTGDLYTLTALERVPIQLTDIDAERLPELVAEFCGPAPTIPTQEDIKRFDEIRNSWSDSAKQRIYELASSVREKFKGDNVFSAFMKTMTDDEKIPFAVFWLLAEVNNGGFHQYLFNSTGAIAVETYGLLKKIGAHDSAKMLGAALQLFGDATPAFEMDIRRNQLESFSLEEHEVLQQLDDQFQVRTEDICAIAVEYLDSTATGK